MSSKDQVVIPGPIRRWQQLRPGDELLVEEHENSFLLRKARKKGKKWLLQWMQECPASEFNLERVRDFPKNFKLASPRV